MNLAPGMRQTALLGEKLLITKIITVIGLSLLLLVGAWSAIHHESAATTPPAASVTTPLPMGQDGSASSPEIGYPAVDTISNAGMVDVAMLGVAGCFIGIICCLIALVVTRGLSVRLISRVHTLLPRSRGSAHPTARPFAPALSLTQLSLSRT